MLEPIQFHLTNNIELVEDDKSINRLVNLLSSSGLFHMKLDKQSQCLLMEKTVSYHSDIFRMLLEQLFRKNIAQGRRLYFVELFGSRSEKKIIRHPNLDDWILRHPRSSFRLPYSAPDFIVCIFQAAQNITSRTFVYNFIFQPRTKNIRFNRFVSMFA